MKLLVFFIALFTAHLQYRLWYGDDGSIPQINAFETKLADLRLQVEDKKQRNEVLYAELADLRSGYEAIEERARYELGMIHDGETFFQIIEHSPTR